RINAVPVAPVDQERIDAAVDGVSQDVVGHAAATAAQARAQPTEPSAPAAPSEAKPAHEAAPAASTAAKPGHKLSSVRVDAGKLARLVVTGHDTEVDKKVAEQISAPLKHLVRNALDHGIEMPAARAAKGKPPEGEVALAAYHQYGLIVIEVRDDGNGIDLEKVVEAARRKGLVDPSREPSEREAMELI